MKTVVITGATSGIGLETAKLLARGGFRVIGIGRSAARCEQAKQAVQLAQDGFPALGIGQNVARSGQSAQAIRAASPLSEPIFFTADLLQQREVNRVAAELTRFITAHCGGELFALINNAGCARGYYMTTEDGYEHQFALNYLAGFLLTHRLLPLLKKAGGRVIMTGSRSHKGIRVHWNDVMLTRRYNPLTAYKQSKLCDILFAKGLNDRYASLGVSAYTVDPGLVRTDIGNKDAGGLVNLIWSVRKLGGVRPEIPAQTYAYLCSQPLPPAGLYYYHCRERACSREVTSENANRLFALSERLCGITFGEEERS